jgi:uncharacterized membrane protein
MASKIDRIFGADSSEIRDIQKQMEAKQLTHQRIPQVKDFIYLAGIGLGGTGLSHALADIIAPYFSAHYPWLDKYSLTSGFFWIVVIATFIGIGLSFSPARKLERVGASKLGTVFLYILVATIGMQMDLRAVGANPGLFAI